MIDGWSRRITRRGTCSACQTTDVPVGSTGRLLSHMARRGTGTLYVRCYWTGRKAQDVRDA